MQRNSASPHSGDHESPYRLKFPGIGGTQNKDALKVSDLEGYYWGSVRFV